jgi:hypothetical protein
MPDIQCNQPHGRKSRGIPKYLTRALVVHLHALDSHSSVIWLPPSGLPKLSSVPEFFRTSETAVAPRLVTHTIFPESVRATNGNIQDEVEFLVERSVSHAGLRPRIKQSGFIRLIFAELPTIPHGFCACSKFDEEDLLH